MHPPRAIRSRVECSRRASLHAESHIGFDPFRAGADRENERFMLTLRGRSHGASPRGHRSRAVETR